ncbi:MAG: nucleotidyl transferase AbiEii/AbiGii toxin family protein [Candidatus Eremiobacteraeota bacterium]|nr:nucleotidyl transferase AbiEii/AbiGii toxin family protein [Candidatus Eremiobacteraeota bacterium]
MLLDYKSIFTELNRLAIDYVVVGGMAVNFHGIPRMTYDIDLMILLEKDNIEKTVRLLIQWGYRVRIPVDPMELADEEKRNSWRSEKNMKAMNFYSDTLAIGEIDILFDSPVSYEVMKAHAAIMEIGKEKIPFASIQDLIAMKEHAGRRQDLSDIEHLRLIMER